MFSSTTGWVEENESFLPVEPCSCVSKSRAIFGGSTMLLNCLRLTVVILNYLYFFQSIFTAFRTSIKLLGFCYMQSVYFLCTNWIFCRYLSLWRWTPQNFWIFFYKVRWNLCCFNGQIFTRSWDVTSHSFLMNACLTLIDENFDLSADVRWPTLSKSCIPKGDFI